VTPSAEHAARDAPHRAEVAIAGHTGDAEAARAGLASADGAVRATALGALDRLDVLGDADVVSALADSDARVRHRALQVAARRPGIDVGSLLDDVDPLVAEQAAWACGEQETVTPETLGRLIAAAGGHSDALVREAAVAALGAIGDERGLPTILAACGDKAAVRRRAVLALAPFDGPEVEAALRHALGDRDWQVRQAAEDLLG
jgi:HEAT repeat protein